MTEFTEEMVTYLLSRNRNTDTDYSHKEKHLYVVLQTLIDSFLKDWIWCWFRFSALGIPDPSKRGWQLLC